MEYEILEQEYCFVLFFFFPFPLLPANRYHHHILMKLQTNLSCLVRKLRDNKAAEITEGPG